MGRSRRELLRQRLCRFWRVASPEDMRLPIRASGVWRTVIKTTESGCGRGCPLLRGEGCRRLNRRGGSLFIYLVFYGSLQCLD